MPLKSSLLSLSVLILTVSAVPAMAVDSARPDELATGWINSPLLGQRREFDDQHGDGVLWFLKNMEAYSDSGATAVGAPVADVTYRGAIRLRIYGHELKLDESALGLFEKSLKERPHIVRLDPTAGSITFYNRVLIEKIKAFHMFKRLRVGESMMAKVGTMPCDLILDTLTIRFSLDKKATNPSGVHPCVVLPHLGEQNGAGFLSRAVSWRLVDRAWGWPEGNAGEKAAVQVAKTLQRLYLEPPTGRRSGWFLQDLRKLADRANLLEINEILKAVEKRVVE